MLNTVGMNIVLGHQPVRHQGKKLNSANNINSLGRALRDSDEIAALAKTLVAVWQEPEPRTQVTHA